jgi:hypothetical protein
VDKNIMLDTIFAFGSDLEFFGSDLVFMDKQEGKHGE